MNTYLNKIYQEYLSFSADEIKDNQQKFFGSLALLVEAICNSDQETLKEFLQNTVKEHLFFPPPWIRLIISRTIMSREITVHDVDFFKWLKNDLRLFYNSDSPIITEIENKINGV